MADRPHHQEGAEEPQKQQHPSAGTLFVGPEQVALFEKLVTRWRVPLYFDDVETPIGLVARDVRTALAEDGGAAALPTSRSLESTIGRWATALAIAVSSYTRDFTFDLCAARLAKGFVPLVPLSECEGVKDAPSLAKVMFQRADTPPSFKAWVAKCLLAGVVPGAAGARKACARAEAEATQAVRAALVAGKMYDEAYWARRCAHGGKEQPSFYSPFLDPDKLAASQPPAPVGTSQKLEKPYRRLTREVDMATVRPAAVLAQALELVEQKMKERRWSYDRALEQFKSIRQDLTVQHLGSSALARQVYKSNARASLAQQDFAEFNLCLQHVLPLLEHSDRDREEFVCYQVLLALVLGEHSRVADAVAEAHALDAAADGLLCPCLCLAQLFVEQRWRAFVLGACAAKKGALACAGVLIDMLVRQARFLQMAALCRAFRGAVPLKVLCHALGFTGSAAADECAAYCRSLRLAVAAAEGDGGIDAESSLKQLQQTRMPTISFK